MSSYRVELTAQANVKAYVYVDAADEEAAKACAVVIAKEGDAEWKYDGADDDTIQVESVALDN